MTRNDRVPHHVRKASNRIGPGRYVDPATGRVYIDSADMDGAFDRMQEDVRVADETRDALRKLDEQRETPPPEVEAQAQEWLVRHAQRLEDSGGWQTRAKARKSTLEGKRQFQGSIGVPLDQEDLDELAAIEAALENDMGHERIPHLPSLEVVTGKWEVLTDGGADLEDRIQSGRDLVEAIDRHGTAVPLPHGLTREQFESVVPGVLETLTSEEVHDEEPEAADRAVSNTSHPQHENPNPPRFVRVTFHKGPLDGQGATVPTSWTGGLLFCREEGHTLEASPDPLDSYPQHVYRCPAHVGEPPRFTSDAKYDRTEHGNYPQSYNSQSE